MTETPKTSFSVILAWTILIVIAELIAFYLIQKSVDDQSGFLSTKVILSCILFGLVVTFSFYKVLSGGTNIPLANLYWIMLSQVGAIAVAYVFFSHKIYVKDWIAIALLFTYLIVTFYTKPE